MQLCILCGSGTDLKSENVAHLLFAHLFLLAIFCRNDSDSNISIQCHYARPCVSVNTRSAAFLFHSCKLRPFFSQSIRYISPEDQKHSADAFRTFVSLAKASKKIYKVKYGKIVTGLQICISINGTCSLLPCARRR